MRSSLSKSSLIICSKDRRKLLQETVESVLRGDQVPTELIIVDQSETPHPKLSAMETDRPCQIRYLHSKIVGAGAARNLGILSSSYSILTFLDDDMFVAPDWFGNLVQAILQAGPRSVISGQVLSGESEVPGGRAPSIKNDREPVVYRGRIRQDVLYTGNMAAYRSVFHEVGLFDERLGPGTRFPSAEDNDLGFRLLEHGYSICYVPDAIVYHRAWRSPREHLSLEWKYGVGRGAFYAKHVSWQDRFMLSRMGDDVKENLLNFLGHIVYRRRLNFDYLVLAMGIFYGALRWKIMQTGGSA